MMDASPTDKAELAPARDLDDRQRAEKPNRPETQVYHDTLDKVYGALRKTGLSETQAMDAVNEMLNAGVLFRERMREDEKDAS